MTKPASDLKTLSSEEVGLTWVSVIDSQPEAGMVISDNNFRLFLSGVYARAIHGGTVDVD